MNDTPLPQGISFFPPRQKAPDFVIGSISINPEKFIQYLNEQERDEKGYVKFNVQNSKAGKPYVSLDTWKTTGKKAGTDEDIPF